MKFKNLYNSKQVSTTLQHANSILQNHEIRKIKEHRKYWYMRGNPFE